MGIRIGKDPFAAMKRSDGDAANSRKHFWNGSGADREDPV